MADENFTPTECAILARQFLTEQEESLDLSLPRIFSVISSCLETYVRMCFEDRLKRELFKQEFELEIVDGSASLTSYLDGTNGRINLRELKQVPIYSGDATYTWVASLNQLLNPRMSAGARACFLEGTTLRTREPEESGSESEGETVTFTVTNYPNDTTELPVELQGEFVRYVASQFLPPNNN